MKTKLFYILLFAISITYSQNNLFDNISTTNQYTEYSSVKDAEGDGTYVIKNKYAIVKFYKEYLPTGEGSKIKIIVDNEGKYKGKERYLLDATTEGIECSGQPYESVLTISKKHKSFVAIDDYVFVLYGAEDDGVSFTKIDRIFVKNKGKVEGKKKKKSSFKEKLFALRSSSRGIGNIGPKHKALQNKNLKKMITDYLVAMKAKQDARTSVELKSEKNLKIAKNKRIAKDAQTEKDEWAEAKRYNDSVKATPKYKDLQRRKAQNERNYQQAKAQNDVTLRNNSSRAIYVGTSHSANRGTKIEAGKTASWTCSRDAYIQIEIVKGNSYSYKASSRKVYSANSGCGKTISVN